MANSSVEAVFGQGAEGISRFFSAAQGTATQITSKTMGFLNDMAARGKSLTPYWKPLGLGTAAGVGLAMVLSTPPSTPSLSVPYVRPMTSSGSGGANNMAGNVHPDSPPVGQPTAPSMVGAGNTARISMPSGHRVKIRGRSAGGLNVSGLQSDLQRAMGGNARVNTNVADHRKSLTEQNITDILSRG